MANFERPNDFQIKKVLQGAASGALAGASTGNPYVIAGGALVGGVGGALEKAPPRIGQAELDALADLRDIRMRRAGPRADETGYQAEQFLAARGLGDSALGDSIARAEHNRVISDERDKLNELEAKVRLDIAGRQSDIDAQAIAETNADTAEIFASGFGLVNQLYNPTQFDQPGIRKIRDLLGLENVPQFDLTELLKQRHNSIDIGGGFRVDRNSLAGKLFTKSGDYLNEIASAFPGGMQALGDLLEQAQRMGVK